MLEYVTTEKILILISVVSFMVSCVIGIPFFCYIWDTLERIRVYRGYTPPPSPDPDGHGNSKLPQRRYPKPQDTASKLQRRALLNQTLPNPSNSLAPLPPVPPVGAFEASVAHSMVPSPSLNIAPEPSYYTTSQGHVPTRKSSFNHHYPFSNTPAPNSQVPLFSEQDFQIPGFSEQDLQAQPIPQSAVQSFHSQPAYGPPIASSYGNFGSITRKNGSNYYTTNIFVTRGSKYGPEMRKTRMPSIRR